MGKRENKVERIWRDGFEDLYLDLGREYDEDEVSSASKAAFDKFVKDNPDYCKRKDRDDG